MDFTIKDRDLRKENKRKKDLMKKEKKDVRKRAQMRFSIEDVSVQRLALI